MYFRSEMSLEESRGYFCIKHKMHEAGIITVILRS